MATQTARFAYTIMVRLVTGAKCEADGCAEVASWYVGLKESSFHWCPLHTVEGMASPRLWVEFAPSAQPS